jgi:hypothetical protein
MSEPTMDEKLSELMAPQGAVARRGWLWESPAGEFRRREGIDVNVDHDAADLLVTETRSLYRNQYGRELSDRELAAVRKQAELRSSTATGGSPRPSSHELAAVHGWGVQVTPGRLDPPVPIGPTP